MKKQTRNKCLIGLGIAAILLISFVICCCIKINQDYSNLISIFLSIKSVLFFATGLLTLIIFIFLFIWSIRHDKYLKMSKLDVSIEKMLEFFGEKSHIQTYYKKKPTETKKYLEEGLLKMRRKFCRVWFWVFVIGILMYLVLCVRECNMKENVPVYVSAKVFPIEKDTTAKVIGDTLFFRDSVIISLETQIKYTEIFLFWTVSDTIIKTLTQEITLNGINNYFKNSSDSAVLLINTLKFPLHRKTDTIYKDTFIRDTINNTFQKTYAKETLHCYYFLRNEGPDNIQIINTSDSISHYDIDKNLLEHAKTYLHRDKTKIRYAIRIVDDTPYTCGLTFDTIKTADLVIVKGSIRSDSAVFDFVKNAANTLNGTIKKVNIIDLKTKKIQFKFPYDKPQTKDTYYYKSETAHSSYSFAFNCLSMFINILLLSLFASFNAQTDMFRQEIDEDSYKWVKWFSYLIFAFVVLLDGIVTFIPALSEYYATTHFVIDCTVAIFSVIAVFGVWGSMSNQYTNFNWGFKLWVFIYSASQIFSVFLTESSLTSLYISIFLISVSFIAKISIIIQIWSLISSKRLSWFFLNEANEYRSSSYSDFSSTLTD